MRNNLLRFLLLVGATGLLTTTAQAQLVLNLDTANKFLWFTGSSGAGNSAFISLDNIAQWDQSPGSTANTLDVSGTVSAGALIDISNPPTLSFESASSGVSFVVHFTTALSNAAVTGTGEANKVSYSSIAGTAISNLENGTTTTLTLVQGSNFGDITVSAVPEPSSYTAIIGGLAMGSVLLRRRGRRSVSAA